MRNALNFSLAPAADELPPGECARGGLGDRGSRSGAVGCGRNETARGPYCLRGVRLTDGPHYWLQASTKAWGLLWQALGSCLCLDQRTGSFRVRPTKAGNGFTGDIGCDSHAPGRSRAGSPDPAMEQISTAASRDTCSLALLACVAESAAHEMFGDRPPVADLPAWTLRATAGSLVADSGGGARHCA